MSSSAPRHGHTGPGASPVPCGESVTSTSDTRVFDCQPDTAHSDTPVPSSGADPGPRDPQKGIDPIHVQRSGNRASDRILTVLLVSVIIRCTAIPCSVAKRTAAHIPNLRPGCGDALGVTSPALGLEGTARPVQRRPVSKTPGRHNYSTRSSPRSQSRQSASVAGSSAG